MRILFISPYFPSNVDQAVFGVHQRMGMFIAALKSMAQLDVLFYVPFRTDTSDAAVGALERALSKKWDASLQVSLCTNFNEFERLSLPRKVGILTRSLFGGACNIF